MNAKRLSLAAAALSVLVAAPAGAQTDLPPTTKPPVVEQFAPDVKNLRFTPDKFRPLPKGFAVVTKGGTLVRFRIEDGARVTFRFRKLSDGKRVGGKCMPGKAKAKKRRCTRTRTIPGVIHLQGIFGDNDFRFSGRLVGKALTPGRYKVAAKAEGLAARSSYAYFKIAPKPSKKKKSSKKKSSKKK